MLCTYFENETVLPTGSSFFKKWFSEVLTVCFQGKIQHPSVSARRLVTAGWVLETAISFHTSLQTKTQSDRMHKLYFPTWNSRWKHACKAANILLKLAISICPSISSKDCGWLPWITTPFGKVLQAEQSWTKKLLFLTLGRDL